MRKVKAEQSRAFLGWLEMRCVLTRRDGTFSAGYNPLRERERLYASGWPWQVTSLSPQRGLLIVVVYCTGYLLTATTIG